MQDYDLMCKFCLHCILFSLYLLCAVSPLDQNKWHCTIAVVTEFGKPIIIGKVQTEMAILWLINRPQLKTVNK